MNFVLLCIFSIALIVVFVELYRRRLKTVGEIIVSERKDGGFIYAFDFDNYEDPRQIKDQKKVVFKVVRAPLEYPSQFPRPQMEEVGKSQDNH
jgi:hypothetical protein